MSTPPRAKRVEHVREHHGDRVVDPYEWLRDKDDPEVIAHLEAENAWAEERTAHLEPLRSAIFEEIRSRTQETDLSVPAAYRGWWYYSRTFEGQQYPAQCRVRVVPGQGRPMLEPGSTPEGEQVLLDGNVEARGRSSSPSGRSRSTTAAPGSPTRSTSRATSGSRCGSRTSRPARSWTTR